MPANHTRAIVRPTVSRRPTASRMLYAAPKATFVSVVRDLLPGSAWARKRAVRPRARYLLHFQEPTWSTTGAAKGRNQAWLMNTLPSAAEVQAKLSTSVGHLAVQGSTLTAFDLAKGSSIVFVYVRRNTQGLPTWKRLVPPAKTHWPTQLSAALSVVGSQWQVTTSNPWMSS